MSDDEDPRITRARRAVAYRAFGDPEAVITDLLEAYDEQAEQVAQMVPKDWHGLRTILAEVYPETTFPTMPDQEGRDDGPRIVSLLRRLDAAEAERDRLAEQVERVRELADILTEQGDHHVPGCEGQADCARCVQLDILTVLGGTGQ